jgi:hypothetical protein
VSRTAVPGRRLRAARVAAATSSASEGAPFAGDCDAERTEQQDLDPDEHKQFHRAEHLVLDRGSDRLRLCRLRLLRLFGLRVLRHGPRRPQRAKSGASGRRTARRGRRSILGHGCGGQRRNGKHDRYDREQARAVETQREMGRMCRQGAISSPRARARKDRSSHLEFIFMNSLIQGG